jgi:hypothetical protein
MSASAFRREPDPRRRSPWTLQVVNSTASLGSRSTILSAAEIVRSIGSLEHLRLIVPKAGRSESHCLANLPFVLCGDRFHFSRFSPTVSMAGVQRIIDSYEPTENVVCY